MEELKRRQQMAEMLQQQAFQPLESQVAPGGMVVPTSPVLGLAKMLQAYMGGKQLRDIDKQKGEIEKGDIASAMEFMKNIPSAKSVYGEGPAAGLSEQQASAINLNPNIQAKPSGLSPDMESAINLQPQQERKASMMSVAPSAEERAFYMMQGAIGSSPRTRMLAAALMKPEEREAYDVKYETGADGKIHAVQYSKTGKRIDLGAASPYEKPAAAAKPNMQRKTRVSYDKSGNEFNQDYNFNPDTGEDTLVGKPYSGKPKAETSNSESFNQTETLRKEYTGQTSQYRSIADAYQKIETAAKNPSPANDISLVYGFMRINDPTSTVREGEYATAENSGGVPERIRNLYNRMLKGERLTPEQRTDFVGSARGLVDSQRVPLNALMTRYSDIARRNKLLPEDVVFDPFESLTKVVAPPPPPGYVPQGQVK